MKKRRILLTLALSLSIGISIAKAQEKQPENNDIISLLKKKRMYNQNNGTGFRIQLYNGLETKAKSLQSRFRGEFPTIYTKIKYDQPDWKIQVGDYRTKLEADRALNKIREKFNGSIVVPL
ncbi:SPOR domain-containing protein [Tenacibaculum piscium]|uniref:SPOR domain-containing protein n=1 Tax=Tenacibaculum piscium TaxID=1458515 RepID=UPI001F34CC04|nr:SPOR domain-containing protein [Tenacibaculum piscium]